MKLIYIVGLGRSGSTVVSEYLASQCGGWALGEVVNVFELGATRNELCQCGETFRDCAFWVEVGRVAFGGWDDNLVGEMRRIVGARDRPSAVGRAVTRTRTLAARLDAERYASVHLGLCRAAAAVSGVNTVVDSSKHPAVAYWLKGRYDDVRYVHLVRDSRAVAWSWSKSVRRPESNNTDLMDRFDLSTSARLWNRTNLAASIVIKGVATAPVTMRYEEFCVDPRTVAANTLATFGIAERFLRPSEDMFSHSDHAIGGNPMRFAPQTQRVRLDEDWRRYMPKTAKRFIARRTLGLMASYGYIGRRHSDEK